MQINVCRASVAAVMATLTLPGLDLHKDAYVRQMTSFPGALSRDA